MKAGFGFTKKLGGREERRFVLLRKSVVRSDVGQAQRGAGQAHGKHMAYNGKHSMQGMQGKHDGQGRQG